MGGNPIQDRRGRQKTVECAFFGLGYNYRPSVQVKWNASGRRGPKLQCEGADSVSRYHKSGLSEGHARSSPRIVPDTHGGEEDERMYVSY